MQDFTLKPIAPLAPVARRIRIGAQSNLVERLYEMPRYFPGLRIRAVRHSPPLQRTGDSTSKHSPNCVRLPNQRMTTNWRNCTKSPLAAARLWLGADASFSLRLSLHSARHWAQIAMLLRKQGHATGNMISYLVM